MLKLEGAARDRRANSAGSKLTARATRPRMQVSIDGEIGATTPVEVSAVARRSDRSPRRAKQSSRAASNAAAQPLGLGRLGVMVGAGLFDRFGLGALGEGRVGEAGGEAVALLLGRRDRLRQARLLGVEVDRSAEREARWSAPPTTICAEPAGARQSAAIARPRAWPSATSIARMSGRSASIIAGIAADDVRTRALALHGMLSSARIGADLVDHLDQPVDLARRHVGSRCASGAGHLATIRS